MRSSAESGDADPWKTFFYLGGSFGTRGERALAASIGLDEAPHVNPRSDRLSWPRDRRSRRQWTHQIPSCGGSEVISLRYGLSLCSSFSRELRREGPMWWELRCWRDRQRLEYYGAPQLAKESRASRQPNGGTGR